MAYKKRSRLRRRAHLIVEVRKYVHFKGDESVYAFYDMNRIRPRRFWGNPVWLHDHIVMPVIRQRMRLPEWKFVRGVMPQSLGLDREDQTLFELEETDE